MAALPKQGEHLIIPCERMLQRYWDELGDFRLAFVKWAEELGEGYERWAARGFPEPPSFDHQEIQTIISNPIAGVPVTLRLGEVLKPQHGNGNTFRQLSRAAELPLQWVVSAIWIECSIEKAERYADLEEAILAAEGAPTTMKELALAHGFKPDTGVVRRLAAAHGIEFNKNPRALPVELRKEAERLICDEGMTAVAAHKILVEDNPSLSYNLVAVWGLREKKRRAKCEVAA